MRGRTTCSYFGSVHSIEDNDLQTAKLKPILLISTCAPNRGENIFIVITIY